MSLASHAPIQSHGRDSELFACIGGKYHNRVIRNYTMSLSSDICMFEWVRYTGARSCESVHHGTEESLVCQHTRWAALECCYSSLSHSCVMVTTAHSSTSKTAGDKMKALGIPL